MAEVLARAIRREARRNEAVGDSLMVSVLPRRTIPVPMVAIGSMPKEGDAIFAFVRGTKDDQFSFYGPSCACDGLAIAGVEFLVAKSPPWWTD